MTGDMASSPRSPKYLGFSGSACPILSLCSLALLILGYTRLLVGTALESCMAPLSGCFVIAAAGTVSRGLRSRVNLSILVLSITFVLLMTEASLSLLARLEIVEPVNDRTLDGVYFDQAPLKFDPVRGYRWIPGPRGMRVANGTLIIPPYRVKADARGYSVLSTTPPRTGTAEKVYLVFGDSFSEAGYLTINWMDRANSLLENGKVFLLSYAVDGGGLANWYHLLHHDIIPNQVDYDGVIFAVYEGDLTRGFVKGKSGGSGVYLQRFSYPSLSTHIDNISCPPIMNLVSPDTFDSLLSHFDDGEEPPWLFGTQTVRRLDLAYSKLGSWVRRKALRVTSGEKRIDCWETLTKDAEDTLLDKMLVEFKARKKTILMASVPSRACLLKMIRGGECPYDDELAALAQRHDVEFFDGLKAFAGEWAHRHAESASPLEFVASHWLKYDGHWNQAGSDLFARKIAEVLRNQSSTTRSAE